MDPNMIAIFSKGISGGVLELAREAKAENFEVLLITDEGSIDKMSRLKLFDKIVGIPLREMYNSRKLADHFSEVSQRNKIETVFSCYDPFGPAVCDILKTHYGASSEFDNLKLCYGHL